MMGVGRVVGILALWGKKKNDDDIVWRVVSI